MKKIWRTVWHKATISVLMITMLGLPLTALARGAGESPINIRPDKSMHLECLPTLQFNYTDNADLRITDDGYEVKAHVPAGNLLHLSEMTYELQQFHFHTPSEHTIEGEFFPLEMHLVHKAKDGTLLVVAVFIKQGEEHAELGEIFTDLPQEGEHMAVTSFNLHKLLPENLESFRYRGGFTTPPYTKALRWVVLAEPIEMSKQQIQAYADLFPETTNRKIQPRNHRLVLTDVGTP